MYTVILTVVIQIYWPGSIVTKSACVHVHLPGRGGHLLLGEEGHLRNFQDVLEVFRLSGRYLGNFENLNICTLGSGQ